jgi:SAM-dependent methyltransferase
MSDAPQIFPIYRGLLRNPEIKRRPGGWEYQGSFYPDYLTVGGACHAVFREALQFCQGRGVDIGAGFWPLPGAVPIDVARGPGLSESLADVEDGSLDYLFSSHCLEHIEDWRQTLAEWVDKVKPGGAVFLYLPHPACGIWRMGSPFVGDAHRWIPTPDIVKQSLTELGCEIVQFDDGPDGMFSFFVYARKGRLRGSRPDAS